MISLKGVSKALGLKMEQNQNLLDFLNRKFPATPEVLRLAQIQNPCKFIYISKNNGKEKFAIVVQT